ncbi:MAG: hypothetical protein ACTSPG_08155 [Candidatus Hodarchaeales archaeon]
MMGIEESLNNIERYTTQILQRIADLQTTDQVGSTLNILIASIEELKKANDRLTKQIQNSGVGSELQSSILSLPQIISSLEQSISLFQKAFESTAQETRDDLKFIKISYVEDVVGNMRNLSKEISEMVRNSTEKTKEQYEASITNFLMINDILQAIEGNLTSLIENQADQLATVAELRDRVNAIIQVELASLRDRIAIYLESSVNELKTSVMERMTIQEESLRSLTAAIEKMNQNINAIPQLVEEKINRAVEEKVISQLQSMEKEMKRMTAFIIKSQRSKES